MNDPAAPIEVPQLLEGWVHGWTVSRRTAPAEKLANGGLKVPVGVPGHVVRYILPGSDLHAVGVIAGELIEPGTWLKVASAPSLVRPMLPERWAVQPTEYLMSLALEAEAPLPAPAGYRLSVEAEQGAANATLTHDSGEPAATARVAFSGIYAIFDQVVTEPAHRRKGLGSVLMQALRNHAVSEGARTGVLVATADGMALYKALGWFLSTPMTAAVIPA